jgi:hypothetical protein
MFNTMSYAGLDDSLKNSHYLFLLNPFAALNCSQIPFYFFFHFIFILVHLSSSSSTFMIVLPFFSQAEQNKNLPLLLYSKKIKVFIEFDSHVVRQFHFQIACFHIKSENTAKGTTIVSRV